jgi:hypothetical protein
MRILKPFLAVLAAGYILTYFSELLFWARPRPGDSLGGWTGTWLVYSLMGFIMLSLIGYFRARSIWALFLAGAAFGWLTEGLVVQTAYEDLPLSLSFTGLAWHALISVLVGLWLVRKALHNGLLQTMNLSAIIGLGYGLWAIQWWLAPDGGVSSIAEFTLYNLVGTFLIMVAYIILDRWLPEPFLPDRWIILIAFVLFGAYFIFVTIQAVPLAGLILPVLLTIIFLTLRRNRRLEPELVDAPEKSPPLMNYFGLLALPVVAIMVYTLATWLGLRWQTNWVLYIITTPTGFVMFILSMIKIWRRQSGPERNLEIHQTRQLRINKKD